MTRRSIRRSAAMSTVGSAASTRKSASQPASRQPILRSGKRTGPVSSAAHGDQPPDGRRPDIPALAHQKAGLALGVLGGQHDHPAPRRPLLKRDQAGQQPIDEQPLEHLPFGRRSHEDGIDLEAHDRPGPQQRPGHGQHPQPGQAERRGPSRPGRPPARAVSASAPAAPRVGSAPPSAPATPCSSASPVKSRRRARPASAGTG